MAKILIGCEESQVVTKAFRDRGHEAYSCDLVETRGNPDWHYQMDIWTLLRKTAGQWDLIILHPPCDKMALCGNRWHAGTQGREDAVMWTLELWDEATRHCKHVVLENPGSVIFKRLRTWGYDGMNIQYIQPYQFGHMEQKKTGLAVYGLPELKPTNDVYEEMMKLPKKDREKVFYMSPGETRKMDRSRFYEGISAAMADQWGNLEEINSQEA